MTTTAAKFTATYTTPDGVVYTRSSKKAPYHFFVQGYRTRGYQAARAGAHWAGGFSTTSEAAEKAATEMRLQGDEQVEVVEL